jgi:hypothetical protein
LYALCALLILVHCLVTSKTDSRYIAKERNKSIGAMAFRKAIALNNSAVDLACCGSTDEALFHLDCAWACLSLETSSGMDSSSIGPIHPLHAAQDSSCHPSTDSRDTFVAAPTISASLIDQVVADLDVPIPPSSTTPPVQGSSSLSVDVELFSVTMDGSTSRELASLQDMGSIIDFSNNTFAFYGRLFAFEVHHVNATTWDRCVPHIPSVLLYNAGLLLYQLGLRNGCLEDFSRALDLFQRSRAMLAVQLQRGLGVAGLDILLLALANNMGHCYSHFQHTGKAKLCVDLVYRVLQHTGVTRCHNHRNWDDLTTMSDDYEFFRLSILLGSNRGAVLPPAA